jgi:hypothetical protein
MVATAQTEAATAIADAATLHDLARKGVLPVQGGIAAVIAELPNIGKGNKSPEGYAYRGIEAVTKHVQPLLAKYGVTIAPLARITDVRPSPAMKDGWQDVYMEVDWTITGSDGSQIAARTTGIGRDRSDKGANKAQTQAYKYLLLHLLCIADGKDDTDGASYEHDRQEAPVWNANTVKQALTELVDGDKAKAKQVWVDQAGDSLTSFDEGTAAHMLAAWEADQETS